MSFDDPGLASLSLRRDPFVAEQRAALRRAVDAKIGEAARRHDAAHVKEPWLRVMESLVRWRGNLMG